VLGFQGVAHGTALLGTQVEAWNAALKWLSEKL
jgi:hypothetical protein